MKRVSVANTIDDEKTANSLFNINSVANTIDDEKTVCCDLIAKVAVLSNKLSINDSKSDQAFADTLDHQDDLSRL